MKLSYEAYDHKFTIETKNDDLTAAQVLELVEQLLLGAGFSQENIDDYYEK